MSEAATPETVASRTSVPETAEPGIRGGPILERARQRFPQLVRLRRELHAHPETGVHNPRAQQLIRQALEPLGLEVTTGDSCSSVTATLRGVRPGRTVLLRADTDALPLTEESGLEFASENPGAAHACGHDAHTAMLLGAAQILATDLREEVAGTVRFVFQPGEEGCGGAERMIDEGLLAEPVDAALALHINPNLPTGTIATKPGPFFASCDEFEIVLTGRGGHASMPHTCTDPIPGGLALGTALLATVGRSFDLADPVLVSLGAVTSGTTSNVIPESATLKGTLRTFNPRSREEAWTRIGRLARSMAEAHGLESRVHHRYGCPVTSNSPEAVRELLRTGAELFGPGHAVEMPRPVMAAEDFGFVLDRVPGALVLVGACPPGTDPSQAAPCHSNRMVLDEECLITGTALHVATALAWTRVAR